MNINNLTNGPVTFTLSGKEFKVKRLNMLQLHGEFEAEIKKTHMDDIVSIAERMTNSKERIDFQRQAMKDIPRGKSMEAEVKLVTESFDGCVKLLWMSLKADNECSMQEVEEILLNDSNEVEMTNLMNFIVGEDLQEEEENKDKLPEGAIQIDVEKKTEVTLAPK